jgi:broad specificity phosphatase PhoE
MAKVSRRAFAALALAGGLCALLGFSPPAAAYSEELPQALRAGGLVILVRHAATFRDQANTDPLHPENAAAQRQLNDHGKASAKAFGDALRQIGAPIGKVYSSQFNRAYETAVLARFKDIEKTVSLNMMSEVNPPDENGRRVAVLRNMLRTEPAPGTNTIIVTHGYTIMAALGRDCFETTEGEASIFRPAAGGYTLLARVHMEEWPHIAAVK